MNTLEQLRAGALKGVRRLKLSCDLTEFPREIFDLSDTLEILDLSDNALSTLPDDLPRLGKLRILFCSSNRYTELPEIVGQCNSLTMVGFKSNAIRVVSARALPPQLRWLILTDNQIEALPEEIGQCAQLQKLMLAGNRLQSLPASLAACRRLELVRIAANRLTAFPDCLLALPRLAWLAYAGNPFCAAQEVQAQDDARIREIHWKDLALHQRLGEGASGVIHRADLRTLENGAPPVAVKVFKGSMTSDGLPHCEMAACMVAGEHPNLIPVLGKVVHHPEAVTALVMALIDPAFVNLAGPPSLESCTRDVYAPNVSFDTTSALTLAHGIASAMRHLHAQGIMHGDLYGHNILYSSDGRVLIGDFGAASFHEGEQDELGRALQRIEVRAFGCLLEELAQRCEATDAGLVVAELQALCAACLSETVSERPLFAEIEARLAACKA